MFHSQRVQSRGTYGSRCAHRLRLVRYTNGVGVANGAEGAHGVGSAHGVGAAHGGGGAQGVGVDHMEGGY